MTIPLRANTEKRLLAFAAQDLLRTRFTIEERNATHAVVNGKALIHFSSNDYLNLATHPDVISAFQHSAQQYGVGSGASPLIAGYSSSHRLLEEAFAEFLNRERALLFNSGYHANIGII